MIFLSFNLKNDYVQLPRYDLSFPLTRPVFRVSEFETDGRLLSAVTYLSSCVSRILVSSEYLGLHLARQVSQQTASGTWDSSQTMGPRLAQKWSMNCCISDLTVSVYGGGDGWEKWFSFFRAEVGVKQCSQASNGVSI